MRIYNKWFSVILVALSLVAFAACSSDDDNGAPALTPVFEQPLTLSCGVGAVECIEFNSPVAWSMNTGAIWCTLSLDGENFHYDISGDAGLNKVYVKIGNEALDFEETVTTLTLLRQGQNEVIANIHRAPKNYELTITDEWGAECEKIAIEWNGVISFDVDANFAFGVSETPEWIEEFTITPVQGSANKKNIYATVAEQFEAFPCTGTVTFMNADESAVFPYEITYSGMEPTAIKIDGVSPWGWSVSPDGVSFSNSNSLTGENIEYTGALHYSIKTFKYESKFLFFEEKDGALAMMSAEDSWLRVQVDATDASQVDVTVDAYPPMVEGSRKGYVLVVPAALYDELLSLYEANPTSSFIDEKYNYVILEATQTSDYVEPNKGFDVNDAMMNKLDCFEETDATYLTMLNNKFGLENVYAVSAEPGMYLHAYPNLTDMHWEGWNPDNTILVDANGVELDKASVGLEIGMNMNDDYYISLQAPVAPIVLVLKGTNGEYLKALVVKSSLVLDPGEGFYVKYRMVEDIPCELEKDMEVAAFIARNYGVKEIYTVSSRVGRTLQIFPNLSENEWNGGDASGIIIIDTEGNVMKPSDVKYEPALDADNNFYASVIVKRNTFILIFVGPDGQNIKAMVVRAS